MGKPGKQDKSKRGRKVRVAFRRNRNRAVRVKDWTRQAAQTEGGELDVHARESVVAKGDLSRKRTIIEDADDATDLRTGRLIAFLGRYSIVDDGSRTWLCTVRRVLRTRLIFERSPLAVGDRVRFRPFQTTSTRDPVGPLPETDPAASPMSVAEPAEDLPRTAHAPADASGTPDGQTPTADAAPAGDPTPSADPRDDGVIVHVLPRVSRLQRRAGRRIHTTAANVDQAIVVTSADQPPPKPHLIDRYIVSALSGNVTPVVCLNKIDLDAGAEALLERYAQLGYTTLCTSAINEQNVDELRKILTGWTSVFVGQSGVGKSALINAVEPGLNLRTGAIDLRTGKGRHTTTTARLIRLSFGGFLVDTPGVRSMSLALDSRAELEALFVEFQPHVPNCHFPDCTHIHEDGCAVRQAVDRGEIHPDRYTSYVRLMTERDHPRAR